MSASVRFDEDGARHVLTDATEGSTLQALRDAAHASGLDPIAALYNEGLALAEEGHFGQAQTRLHVLLGLAPSDGGAHLLLAKVYVAGQQWRRALAALDDAAQCGAHIPDELRTAVVRHLAADDQADAGPARDAAVDGELRKLKSETRRLRSENAHLITQGRQLERELRSWAWIATGTSFIAICFMAGRLLFGGPDAPIADESVAVVQPPVDEPVADLPPVRNADTAVLAKSALEKSKALSDSELEVVVRAGHAELTGSVLTFAQVREAVRLLSLVPGIDEIGRDGVRIRARTEGAIHTVVSGDTLSKIAWDHYGDETRYEVIISGNEAMAEGRTALKIGQQVIVPALPAVAPQ